MLVACRFNFSPHGAVGKSVILVYPGRKKILPYAKQTQFKVVKKLKLGLFYYF